MRRVTHPLFFVVTVGVLLVWLIGRAAASNPAAETEVLTPHIYSAQYFDTSAPLSELSPEYPDPSSVNSGRPVLEVGRLLGEGSEIEDTVAQHLDGANRPAALNPLSSWEGVGNLDGKYPPDVNGDVGADHYVLTVNSRFQIYNLVTGAPFYATPPSLSTLWQGTNTPCATRNDGDPVVLYDQMAGRWLISQFTVAAPYGECVAISATSDPTGSYHRYYFTFQQSATELYDYPHFSMWSDGYYMTANRYQMSGTSGVFRGASAIVLDRAAMLNGQNPRVVEFTLPSNAESGLLASDLDGTTPPPAGAPNTIFALWNTSTIRTRQLRVNWNTPSASTLSEPNAIAVAGFNQLCFGRRSCVTQPDSPQGLDGLGDRLMQRAAYRNFGTHQSVVLSHAVDADATSAVRAGVRWYEFRSVHSTPTIYQQSTLTSSDLNRWMSSVAMDKMGNMGMVYSVSSGTVYPSIQYTGRLNNDPLNQMTQGETPFMAGSGAQIGVGARWGDYTNITVDPDDECTFWFAHEYVATTGAASWQTRIGSFRFPNCEVPQAPPTVDVTHLSATCAANVVTISWDTTIESGISGFNVLRAASPDGTPVVVNPSVIPTRGAGSGQGATYAFQDTTLTANGTYYYWVDAIATNGDTTRFGHTNTAYPCTPMSVTVASFGATCESDLMRLTWQTGSETNVAGFILLRAATADGTPVALNNSLIPSQSAGNGQGALYTYADTTLTEAGDYFYWLDAVSTTGERERFGAVEGNFPCATPTVTVISFGAYCDSDQVDILWETGVENQITGFNLLRGLTPTSTPVAINEGLIPSKAVNGQGATYTYEDASLRQSSLYYYWLDAVDANGETTRFGPATVAYPCTPTAVRVSNLTSHAAAPSFNGVWVMVGLIGIVGVVWWHKSRP